MNFDYGNILTRTFQITWKYKVFWGILTIPMLISFAIFPVMFLFLFFFEENQTSEMNALITVLFFAFFFLIIVVSTILQVFALSAVTLGIVRVERGEGSLKFIDLLQDSREYFWRQLGVFLIVQLSVGLIFTIFFAFVFAATMVTMGLASICLQPLFILITPLSFLMIGVLEAAHTAVITENLSAWDAVKRGAEIVRDHVWKYIILTIIIYFGITIISSFLMFPMFIPLMGFPIFAESGGDFVNSPLMVVTILFLCIFFPIMAFISAISQTLLKTALDLTYLHLTHKGENQVIVNQS
ncbi:MAG: hypothetical protein JNM46_10070 [Anaerolineales bacterium]|nr:hypothetical protein [Anaerolineales bacterium]